MSETFGKFTFEDEAADPTAKRLAFGGAASTSEIDSNLLMEAEVLRIQNGGAIQAHWMLDDDEDATVGDPTSTEEMALLDSIPQPENLKKDYKKELERLREAAEQPNADYAALSLKMQLLKELRGSSKSEHGLSKDLPSTLPAKLLSSYDFQQAKVSITEHIELLEDFMIDQPDRKRLRFLMTSLTGRTLKHFRKFYRSELSAQKSVSYERAKAWLLLKCTHKQERTVVFKLLQTVAMKPSETVEDLIERITEMRRQLESMGISETNFHVRQYLERAIEKGASNVYEKIQCEVGWESWTYRDF